MNDHTQTPHRPQIILIVSDDEWSARSLETVLGPHGFAVLRAYTGADGLTRARSHPPDVIVVDLALPDMDGVDLIQICSESPRINDTTPIIATSAAPISRAIEIAALRAGAWEVLSDPLDVEAVVLKLNTFLRARLAVERLEAQALLDHSTGLYNSNGLARRGRELGHHAFRQKSALACVVLTFRGGALTEEDTQRLRERIAAALRQAGRNSDVIGHLGSSEFGIIAPGTDDDGAQRLAERIMGVLDAMRVDTDPTWELAAGFDAIDNYRDDPVDASDMLRRATDASRRTRQNRIRRFNSGHGL